MVIVEVMDYSDFDILRTRHVMVHDGAPDMSQLKQFDFSRDRDCKGAVRVLENMGFRCVTTRSVVVGGGL